MKTLAGCWYTITCTAAVTVTEDVRGAAVPLAVLKKAGVAVFRASQAKVCVVTDGEFVVLPTDAPAALGFCGGGGGDVSDMYADLSDEQKQDLASRACYQDAALYSGNGAGDADMCVRWAQLSVSHLPAMDKPLREVRIPCCTTASAEMDTEPRYLGLWVEEEDGSFSLLGVSSAPARQVEGQETVWPFVGDIVLEVRRPVRLRLLSSPTGTWDDPPLVLGARGKAADADGCYVCNTSGGTQNTQLEMSVTMLDRTPLFAPISHVNDESKHVTLADKVFLNSARDNTLGVIINGSSGITISNQKMDTPGDRFVCIGPSAEHWYESVTIGYCATAGQGEYGGVAVGYSASAKGGSAVGYWTYAEEGVAVGRYASSYGRGVAVGDCSTADASQAVALGSKAHAAREGGLALGSNSIAYDVNAVALGSGAYVDDEGVVGLCSSCSEKGIYSMLYFVGCRTPLAYKMSAAGDAGLGYIEVDTLAGQKLCSYWKSLYDLLDINENFVPTGWENIGYYY